MRFIDLSNKIEPLTVKIFKEINSVASSLGLNFIVVGATARDFFLESYYGINPVRATMDIDLGLCLNNWEQFEQFKDSLVSSRKFKTTRSTHKIKYADVLPIDLIPFGDIISKDRLIEWPPDQKVLMNVAGFEEAYKSCISVKLGSDPDLTIKIASLPGLLVLKLIAWKDRGNQDNRDGVDIATIITNYGTPVNEERLYENESELLEIEEDLGLAGARLLGRDITKIVGSDLLGTILTILDEETSEMGDQRLAISMTNRVIEGDFQIKFELLKKLKAGIEDKI